MNALIEKILNIISNLPDPAGLTKVVQKIEESNNTLGFDEAKNLLLNNFFRIQTGRKGVIIDHVKLRSVSPCSECGIDINNGYFRILKMIQPHSYNKEAFEIKQKIIMSYEVLHHMKEHKSYNKIHCATNECYGELEITNSKKNPRDQLSQQELQNQIKKFTIEELEKELTNMIE